MLTSPRKRQIALEKDWHLLYLVIVSNVERIHMTTNKVFCIACQSASLALIPDYNIESYTAYTCHSTSLLPT